MSMSTEKDPTGLDAHAPGAKLDDGKVRADLMLDGFGLALLEVAKVSTYGAQKYSEHGWRAVQDGVKRYRAAGDRHRLRRYLEETYPDTRLLHLAHEAWNRLAELEMVLRGAVKTSETPPAPMEEAVQARPFRRPICGTPGGIADTVCVVYPGHPGAHIFSVLPC